jgi:carbon monoxide dehydrogenase subunit G
MVDVSDSVRVAATPQVVFEYLDDPHNHVEITPSLVDVADVEPLDNGGKRAEFVYSIAGVNLRGDLVQTVYDPDERMAFDLRGQLPGTIDVRLEPEAGGTRVTYTGTYEIPGRVLSRVAEPFVRRYNERELRTLLENLKTRLEGS